MQFCKVEIQLGGDMTNTVIKSGVSVPEIVLLREIHGGAPSVRVISIESTKPVSSAEELGRLRHEYSTAVTDLGERLVDKVFPGVGVKLAQTLDDIGDIFVMKRTDIADDDESPDETAELLEIAIEPASKGKR